MNHMKKINGNDLLYRFFKDLIESDQVLGMDLSLLLITRLGIWLPREIYSQIPILLPFVVRDPECRRNTAKGRPDEWSSPNSEGFLRDDNSLVKAIPRSLEIRRPEGSLLTGNRIGVGFVASHIWREVNHKQLASRIPMLNTFVPNLVWLPAQVAKLSDIQGGPIQKTLESISVKLYKDVPVETHLQELVDKAWNLLPPPSIEVNQSDLESLNFFRATPRFLNTRLKRIDEVRQALTDLSLGNSLDGSKVISRRYTQGLPNVTQKNLLSLLEYLNQFIKEP
jgi:hypothetical protein